MYVNNVLSFLSVTLYQLEASTGAEWFCFVPAREKARVKLAAITSLSVGGGMGIKRREGASLMCRTLGKMTPVATSFGRSSTDIDRIRENLGTVEKR